MNFTQFIQIAMKDIEWHLLKATLSHRIYGGRLGAVLTLHKTISIMKIYRLATNQVISEC